MDSFQASLWREMAKEALGAADRIGNPGGRAKSTLWPHSIWQWPNGLKPGRQPTNTDRDKVPSQPVGGAFFRHRTG